MVYDSKGAARKAVLISSQSVRPQSSNETLEACIIGNIHCTRIIRVLSLVMSYHGH